MEEPSTWITEHHLKQAKAAEKLTVSRARVRRGEQEGGQVPQAGHRLRR